MKFLLTIFLTITLASIDGQQYNEQKLNDIINLIWPPNGFSTTESPIIPDMSSTGSRSGTCKCVPYRFCKNVTSCTNDCNVIDITNSNNSCRDYLTTCCEDENIVKLPLPILTDGSKPKGCGVRHPNGVGYRIRGNVNGEAEFGEFPWMVAVLLDESIELDAPQLLVYQCGGSLIHPQVVLTATHCALADEPNFYIRAGEWDTQTKNEVLPYQDRKVAKIIEHPGYHSGTLFNDISLMVLETPFNILDNVNTVCLPPPNVILDNTRCFASGWGKDTFGQEGKYQVILKKIGLPVVPRALCQEQLRQTRLRQHYVLHESFICAGGEKDIDTCKGDGGGPLVCPIPENPTRYYQGGIVSWGVDCGLENVPALYANVPHFRNWVDAEMVKLGYDTSSYTY